ncbi:HD domain-containing protein [Kribbella sp. NBC_00382]|uniref:HD domain-containing protein n=1 Tax=Kribbella sp. NBC_00382 TaxID=2975967 RepID=UPI002E1B444B
MVHRELAEEYPAEQLPIRWAHERGVAQQAAALGARLGGDGEVLVAAAWLHDIGYSPELVDTRFHPLDGARFLRRKGIDERVVRLVAHHTAAMLEAGERGLAGVLIGEFELEESPTADLLWYCDLTTGPRGQRLTVVERLAEIKARYGPEHPVTRFIMRAEPELLAVAERVEGGQ